ncbi:TOMM system kinase/cyclase fusion protein [Psychromonas sp. Urea-02u-13]|uniref:TOMM system kinase/cyclase fusion protein n=1 Tax=Psychromonas sp. Urea-02u-13 TaxID=2058326 RepID=UPI000C3413BF|nr:TOMM system kinase/cyclase fusion protein [Psychromonas sp. Urea-02u-13]PKG39283.1 TOMM system kinase/cyclase fusion protein [Psychromonas sp. Urea-02u-13]
MTLLNDKISQQFDSSAYQLLEKIGEGGFGHVYLAKQVNTGQSVAIKFLSISNDFDDNKRQRYVERFERETLLGSRLQHPNIVRLLDKGESGDLLFAVFEYVEGITLKQRLTQSGALSAVEATDVMTQVLDALAHAHQQGVVHRDIKPANIMLTESAAKLHIKVLDFGIGTLVNEARVQDYKSITLTQETLGTPSYSSPEQLRGEPATVKTDLYVWGLVFIECLTGQPAMSGSNLASIFHKQLSQENVALPSAIVGHPLAALLRRVLQKKAHLRSVNAPDLYHEIQHINVANLVGELQSDNESKATLVNVVLDNDVTLINDNPIFNTGHVERKQFTVMAVRLNAHIVKGKEVDQEVIDTLHRDQKNQCLDTAIRYGAFHVGTLGDTQLFYYGYPAASDNDARLCARTALDLISDLKKRNALLKVNQGIQLEIKIGIHTGLLTCYADATPEGDTANIALQLVRLAGNDQILCSDSSQKILQSYLEFNPVSHQPLGVSSTTTPLFNLMAERHVEAFGFLRAAHNNHLFIGREQEISALRALQTSDSEVKLAHVFGEAGIGKSRLTFEFRHQSSQYTHFMGQCLPEHINNALYPILNILKYKYALTSLSDSDAISKLSTEISLFDEINLDDILPILCAWLGYQLLDDMAPSSLSPDLQKQLLFKTLNALLNKQDNQQANLFVFEDMHWADPTSLEFIHHLSTSESFKNSNNVFISNSRQPLPAIFDSEIYQSIALNKLTEQDSKSFINNLFDNQNVASQVMNAVLSRTDGIPLFIEELVDMLKQKGLVQHINGITDFINSEKIAQLPTSLRDSLQQKLDSLVYSKETAQLAATIGREFDYDLLVASSNRSEAQLQTDLDELVCADIILQKRRVTGDSYLFKHALVRDAAYESMPSNSRQKKHKTVALSLESQLENHQSSSLFLIATHFSSAEMFNKAVSFGLKSANQALEQLATAEVVLQTDQILLWSDHLDKAQQIEMKLAINNLLTTTYMQTHGWASEKVKQCTDISIELLKAKPSKNNNEIIPLLWWRMFTGLVSGQRSDLENVEKELESVVKEAPISDKANIFGALAYYRYTGGFVGKYITDNDEISEDELPAVQVALKYALRSATYNVDIKETDHINIYGWDYQSFAWALLGRVYWDLGQVDNALKFAQKGVAKARLINHPPSLCISLMYLSIVHQYQGDHSACEQSAFELVNVAKENSMPIYEAYGGPIYSWAINDATHEQKYLNGLEIGESKHAVAFFSSLFSDVFINQKEYKKALERLTSCIALCESVNEHYYEPQLYQRRALCRLDHYPAQNEIALNDLKKGRDIAKKMGAIHIVHEIEKDIHKYF